jgi:tryptophan 2,3-dioxygenase
MKLIKNNAVLSFQLDNTAHKMHKHQAESMPAQYGKAAQPISFADFERHCAERFLNINAQSMEREFAAELSAFMAPSPKRGTNGWRL